MLGSDPSGGLVGGRWLVAARAWPLSLRAVLCDLRAGFLPKGRVGRGYRAVSRNGRVLLASSLPLPDLAGLGMGLRLQTWHRAILPGDSPAPYGVLLCLRPLPQDAAFPEHESCLAPTAAEEWDLYLDLGGRRWLAFRRRPTR